MVRKRRMWLLLVTTAALMTVASVQQSAMVAPAPPARFTSGGAVTEATIFWQVTPWEYPGMVKSCGLTATSDVTNPDFASQRTLLTFSTASHTGSSVGLVSLARNGVVVGDYAIWEDGGTDCGRVVTVISDTSLIIDAYVSWAGDAINVTFGSNIYRIDDEIIGVYGFVPATKRVRFARGLFGTEPVRHDSGTVIYAVEPSGEM